MCDSVFTLNLGTCLYGLRQWINRNLLALLIFIFKLHYTWDQGENGEIFTQTNVLTRVEFSSTLTTDDLARFYYLSAKALDSKHFRVTVASVSCTTTGFFVCHDDLPSSILAGLDWCPNTQAGLIHLVKIMPFLQLLF